MRQAVKGRRLAVLFIVAVAGLVAAGISYAVIPDANGVINGCYDNKTGLLRAIDPSQGQTCASKETALNWNQTGPQGPQGVQGPQGPAGPGVEAVANINGLVYPTSPINPTLSRGMGSAVVNHASTGVYCIEGLSFQPLVVVGNAKPRPSLNGLIDTDTVLTARINPNPGNPNALLAGCEAFANTQVEVALYGASTQGPKDTTFVLSLED